MNIIERAGWTGFFIGLIFGVVTTVSFYKLTEPTCYEDGVLMWDGDDHTICVNIDDMAEAVIDEYLEVKSQPPMNH